jgi:hypothetical protein
MGEKRTAQILLVESQKERKPLERSGRRWVDNIKIDLGDVNYGGVDWIGLSV